RRLERFQVNFTIRCFNRLWFFCSSNNKQRVLVIRFVRFNQTIKGLCIAGWRKVYFMDGTSIVGKKLQASSPFVFYRLNHRKGKCPVMKEYAKVDVLANKQSYRRFSF